MLDGELIALADGSHVVHFERFIPRTPAEVWRALTEPALLERWLSPGVIEPRVGGKYVIDWRGEVSVMHGVIKVFEPGRVLAYTWAEDPPTYSGVESLVRWELSPAPGGCKVVLTHTAPPNQPRTETLGWLGGWHGFDRGIATATSNSFVADEGNSVTARWKNIDAQYRAKYEAAEQADFDRTNDDGRTKQHR